MPAIGFTIGAILEEHYKEIIQDMVLKITLMDQYRWRGAWEIAIRWSRRNLKICFHLKNLLPVMNLYNSKRKGILPHLAGRKLVGPLIIPTMETNTAIGNYN